MNHLRNEDGAALISVLLLVSVMSAALVATFDLLGYYTRNSTVKIASHQAREYALAAEMVGSEQAIKLAEQVQLASFLTGSVENRLVSFPIEGGMISGKLQEYTNCFNLASLVKANNARGFEINQTGHDQFVQLLIDIGIGDRQALLLAANLVDWQDTDSRPLPLGSEDFYYSQLEIPYRAANAPIGDIDELRLVSGFTPELIEALLPITCVDAVSMETVLNLNSLTPEQTILLHSVLGLPLSLQNINSIIKDRPSQGYDHVARFWDHKFLADKDIKSEVRRQFDLSPKRYKIFVEVILADIHVNLESLISLNNDSTYTLINRKYGD